MDANNSPETVVLQGIVARQKGLGAHEHLYPKGSMEAK
jgi:hypothetical protein